MAWTTNVVDQVDWITVTVKEITLRLIKQNMTQLKASATPINADFMHCCP